MKKQLNLHCSDIFGSDGEQTAKIMMKVLSFLPLLNYYLGVLYYTLDSKLKRVIIILKKIMLPLHVTYKNHLDNID